MRKIVEIKGCRGGKERVRGEEWKKVGREKKKGRKRWVGEEGGRESETKGMD